MTMSTSESKPVAGLPKTRITIKKGEKCAVCREEFLDEKLNLKKPVMDVPGFGPAHEPCFLPYHQEDEIRVLVQVRCYSIGDTIASTPVVRELRRLYPKIKITVLTFFPDLFKYSPHVDGILDLNKPVYQNVMDSFHFKIDAFSSETRHHFAMHSSEFAFQSAFLRSGFPNQYDYEVNYHRDDLSEMKRIRAELGILETDRLVLLNPHRTEWPTRDWPLMPAVAKWFHERHTNLKIVSIGGKRGESREMKNYVSLGDIPHVDAYGKFSLLQSLAFMDQPNVEMLVTPDTGTLHMGATSPDLKIVGIFTLIRAYFRTPVRRGRFAHRFLGVESGSKCCCTYDAKLLTDETNFKECPKRTFLENTLRAPLPRAHKLEGMRNYDRSRDWKIETLNDEIREEAKRFQTDRLPCFPSVEDVTRACQRLLETP